MKLYGLLFLVSNCFAQSHLSSSGNKDLWYHKDFILDNFHGTSLEKWKKENKKHISNKIIVATLDTQIDLEHEDLQDQFWINKSEIPHNGIDDDKNGYIDDINGWHFVGKPNGGYFIYGNFEYTRIVRKYDSIFKNKKKEDIEVNLQNDFNEYTYAKNYLEYYLDYYSNWRKSLTFNIEVYSKSKDTLKYFFPKENYNISDLDSLFKKHKINDKPYWQRRDDNDTDLGSLIHYMIVNYQQNFTKLEHIVHKKNELDSIIMQNLNVDFVDRKYIKDNPEKLEKGYGNNFLNSFKDLQYHNTEVSSIIAANSRNNIGTSGFHKNIKLMPLITSVSGDENDKDIAMAIYYAVDNGAKVINMSFGKEFSLHQEWVSKAIKYAEENNVLIVLCAANQSKNIDNEITYPRDTYMWEEVEISNNCINVGSISKRIDSTIVSPFSNYGKNNVDIFAPGEDIYVAIPDNQYKYDSGTSLAAPMISGTAALIWLYYTNLTVQEVKQIILQSGVTIDKQVIKPGTENELVPFSELCKSGKILNTYNAMKMAEEISKKK
ncbi:S8 family serine peptidase [Flavobacterium sp. J27]|uniref:S8 family serine peptidase n=1 Tax=Flavobacterium sp. J27 TaxID=2060419 RepID=UPI001031830A|nr:S8 family serine peptidase [Flavobacterium sp. J27]